MPYIGKPPGDRVSGLGEKNVFTGDGSTVAFDLGSEATSENDIDVFIDNVRQEPGSGKAYTLGNDGSGDLKRITFSAAPDNSAEIYVINRMQDNLITTVSDNSITGAKIALGSDAQGDIMYYNGTDYVRHAPGTSGQFLKTQGAAANPTWADVPAGAPTGGGTEKVFYENENSVDTNYTLTTNFNAVSAGPVTVASGITVTIPAGQAWVIV